MAASEERHMGSNISGDASSLRRSVCGGKLCKRKADRRSGAGYILIHTTDGEEWGFYGDMEIISDGTDGTDIDIDMTGWLVGSTHSCYNPELEEKGR